MNSKTKTHLIAIIVVLISSFFFYQKNTNHHDYIPLSSQPYPLQKATIEIFYEEPVGFGPHQVKVELVLGEEESRTLVEEKIYNDGSNLSQRNVGIERFDDSIEITLRGSEQDDVVHTISLE